MATLKPSLRQGLLAGAVAVALTGGGAAVVWAGTQPGPSPSGSSSQGSSASQDPSASPSPSASGKLTPTERRGQPIHGEHVVKQPDGSYRTILTQAGSIESISDTEITVKSDDGFTQRYVITAEARVSKLPADVSELRNGKGKQSPPSATASDLKAGDAVRVSGTKDGDKVTATRILSGDLPAGIKGHGHMRGHGPK